MLSIPSMQYTTQPSSLVCSPSVAAIRWCDRPLLFLYASVNTTFTTWLFSFIIHLNFTYHNLKQKKKKRDYSLNQIYYSNYLKQQYRVNKNLFSPKFKINCFAQIINLLEFRLQHSTKHTSAQTPRRETQLLSNLIQPIEKDASKFSACFKMR